MSSRDARQIKLTKRPKGPISADSFELISRPAPEASTGQVVIRNHYLSLDPYMRSALNNADNLGKPIEGRVVGQIMASRHPGFREGDWVFAMGRWEEISLVEGAAARHVDINIAPASAYLGVLGFTGLTAWSGLRHYGGLREGETLFVSAASGAVGSIAGQIGKIGGMRVAGCAGTDAKVAWLTEELGFDAAFNHRTASDITESVARACPEGIDIDYENVGGEVFDAVFRNMRLGGRIVVCGAISQYEREPSPCVPNIADFIGKRLTMRGFSVRDHAAEINDYIDEAAGWLRDGKLKYRETIVAGIENAPAAFARLFSGDNFGKLVIHMP
ncbi:NADP-dependent oxidoreductase [Emcibacter sp. SYSU 3D8]|uniref:NADP-dependent oxidoreductase n=1 Tax=Emcibacter sp. SYSU 3D8 TaxID=3133969 RepID=UPI0031FEBA55